MISFSFDFLSLCFACVCSSSPGNHITMNAKTMIHNWASILKKTLDHLGQ